MPRLSSLHDLDSTEGTVRLRDPTSEASTLVLIPRPSRTDPDDPLRWPKWKKHLAFSSVCLFTFLTNFGIGGLSPAFYTLSLELDRTSTQTSQLLLWPIFVLGVFNFLWVPLANYIGKRPLLVCCSCLLAVSLAWGAVSRSFSSLLWSSIVAAFAGSATETLAASMVNDTYFLHERGGMMGAYIMASAGGNTVGPLICGAVLTHLSWRWFKWIACILAFVAFGLILFCVPETRYLPRRGLHDPILETVGSSEDDTVASTPTKQEAVVTTFAMTPATTVVPQTSQGLSLRPPPLWTTTDGPAGDLSKMFARPFPMIAYPCVLLSLLGYAVSLVATVAVNVLSPFVLQAPPYSWSPLLSGLINLAGLVGNLVGAYAGGALADVFCDWVLRRRDGLFEPETRLWLLAIPLLISTTGCVVFGFGMGQELGWWALFLGYGMISCALTAVPALTMSYVSDCLFPVNSDALMLVNGMKNIIAFGFLYGGIVKWADDLGYLLCFVTQAAISAGVIVLGMVILIPFGAKIRHKQAKWAIILSIRRSS